MNSPESKRKKHKKRAEDETKGQSIVKGSVSTVTDVKIKAIGENPDEKIAPIVGYFPSGYDALSSAGDPDSEIDPNPSVKVYRSLNSPNPKRPRMQLVVGVPGSQVSFVGTNYSGEGTTPQLCNYALGVFDKETKVLKIVPVAANRIFRLEPRIGSLKEPEDEVPEEEISRAEMGAQYRKLTTMYSTLTNMRKDAKRQALRRNEDAEAQQELDQTLKEIKINKDDFAINESDNSRNIPPYDLAATAPEMVYPLNKIIFEGEWYYLEDIFEIAESGSEVKLDVYPSFICNRISKIKEVEDELEKRRMAGILSYIAYLIRFRDKFYTSSRDIYPGKHRKLPSLFSQKFSSMFSLEDGRIPDEKKQLLLRYILVLSLFADNFRSDPADIAKDLRMTTIELRPHYEFLGCKLVKDERGRLATLPIPLEFPRLRRRWKKKAK